MNDQQVRIVLSASADGVAAAASTTTGALNNVSAAASKASNSLQQTVAGTAAYRNQMRMVAPQLTDIFVSLASGQQPLMVLLQQGGQLKDMFGGIAPAAKAVGGALLAMINPVTAVVAAVAAVGYVASAGWREQEKLAHSLALTGNIAGQTADSFVAASHKVADSANISIEAAKDLVQGAISSGAFGPAAVEQVTAAMGQLQRLTGQSSDEIVKQFAGMGRGVAAWAADANRSYNFLSVAQFKHIQELEKQGKAQEAMEAAGKALADTLGQRVPTALGTLDKVLQAVGNTWSAFWDKVHGIGRTKTLGEQIADAQQGVQNLSAPQRRGTIRPGRDEALSNAQDNLSRLVQQKAAEDLAAANAAKQAAKNQAGIAGLLGAKPAGTYREAPDSMETVLARQYEWLEKEQEKQLRGLQDAVSDEGRLEKQRSEQQATFNQNRIEQLEQFSTSLQEQTAALNISLITDDRARGLAQIENDRQTMAKRIAVLAAGGADMTDATDSLNANIAARTASLTDQLKPEFQRLQESWQSVTQKMSEVGVQFQQGFVDGGRDAFKEFLVTGRIGMDSFKGLVIETITKLIYDRMLSQQMANLGGMLINGLTQLITGGGLGGFGGSSTGAGVVSGGSGFTLPGVTRNAMGANNFPGGYRVVGEQGPELEATGPSRIFNASQTRDILGGRRDSGRGAPLVNITQHINVANGASMAQVQQGMKAAKDSAVAEIRRQVVQGNRLWDR